MVFTSMCVEACYLIRWTLASELGDAGNKAEFYRIVAGALPDWRSGFLVCGLRMRTPRGVLAGPLTSDRVIQSGRALILASAIKCSPKSLKSGGEAATFVGGRMARCLAHKPHAI